MQRQFLLFLKYQIIYLLRRTKSLWLEARRRSSDSAYRTSADRLGNLQFTARAFDEAYYYETNPDVKDAGEDAFIHFMMFGFAEGRRARFFDNAWYLNRYRDVASLTHDGIDHFSRYGAEEKREARYIIIAQEQPADSRNNYQAWLQDYEPDIMVSADQHAAASEAFRLTPKISIIVPVYDPPLEYLTAAIESVRSQTYENWELCLADDASKNPKVRELLTSYAKKDVRIKVALREKNGHISEASNSALALATGEFIALLDHDDLLAHQALFWVVDAINADPAVDVLYSDEDKIDNKGRRLDPYFKSAFNYELFLAQNMMSHLSVYRSTLVTAAGGFRKGYEGSQDHDLALRVLELTHQSRIHHIPRILYHWRILPGSTAMGLGEKNYAAEAGRQAVADHLARLKVKGAVTIPYPEIGHYRVRYALPAKQPLVSIIIPTRDQVGLLKQCIDSIMSRSTYRNYEVIIVDNGSKERETLDYLDGLPAKKVRVIRDDRPFNYSALNNAAVAAAKGAYVVLMNNDIEVITPDWLEEMVSFGQRPDIGCVGARLWYPDKTLQHGGVILGIGGVAGHAHKYFDSKDMGYFCRAAHHQSFSAVTAACLLVRKDTYTQVGGLNENLAVAFNDVDFCLRVREAGYRNVWTPYAELFHHESASRGKEDTPEKKARFLKEASLMMDMWQDVLTTDPAYSPNLTLEHEDFSLAWPPRVLASPPLSHQ